MVFFVDFIDVSLKVQVVEDYITCRIVDWMGFKNNCNCNCNGIDPIPIDQ